MVLKLKLIGYSEPVELRMVKGQYSNGRLALMLEDAETREPWAKLTVNIPDQPLAQDEFFVKGWSENASIVIALRRQTKLFTHTGRIVPAGFCDAMVWKFSDPKTLNKIPNR